MWHDEYFIHDHSVVTWCDSPDLYILDKLACAVRGCCMRMCLGWQACTALLPLALVLLLVLLNGHYGGCKLLQQDLRSAAAAAAAVGTRRICIVLCSICCGSCTRRDVTCQLVRI